MKSSWAMQAYTRNHLNSMPRTHFSLSVGPSSSIEEASSPLLRHLSISSTYQISKSQKPLSTSLSLSAIYFELHCSDLRSTDSSVEEKRRSRQIWRWGCCTVWCSYPFPAPASRFSTWFSVPSSTSQLLDDMDPALHTERRRERDGVKSVIHGGHC